MPHLQFAFQTTDQSAKDTLIAQLSNINFEGFEETDSGLLAYILESQFDDSLFKSLIYINHLNYAKSIVNEKNWNENWERDFQPIIVKYPYESSSIFAFIRASFHSSIPNAKYDISITPKMSFGTGHHATTYQMIQQMSMIDFQNKNVVDFGTGTGVLAILAEKLGAQSVIAIDNDDWSIMNVKENIEINQCAKISVIKETFCHTKEHSADVMLANINLNVIIDNLEHIKKSCKPNSIVLFSGILTQDEPLITEKLTSEGFTINKIESKDNWLIISTYL